MSMAQLTVYSTLSRAGIPSDNANEVEQAIKQLVDTGVEGVRQDVRDLREQTLTKSEAQVHRAEIMAEFQKVQADLHKVQADLHKAINDLTIKMFGSMLASTGIIVAVVIKLAA